DLVTHAKLDATNAVGRPSHGPNIVFAESDGLALAGADEDLAGSVGQLDAHHGVPLVDADGDDTADARIAERAQLGFLDRALPRCHHDEVLIVEFADGQHVGDMFAGLELHEVCDGLAAAVG